MARLGKVAMEDAMLVQKEDQLDPEQHYLYFVCEEVVSLFGISCNNYYNCMSHFLI